MAEQTNTDGFLSGPPRRRIGAGRPVATYARRSVYEPVRRRFEDDGGRPAVRLRAAPGARLRVNASSDVQNPPELSPLKQPSASTKHLITTEPKIRPWVLTVLALVLFVGGASVSYSSYRTNESIKAQIARLNQRATTDDGASSNDGDAPATDKPSTQTVEQYQVAPDLPRYIRIAKINVSARVRQLGLTKDGALASPTNVYDAGWYMGSAKPGEPGATVIDGHVSSWEATGVFYNLKKLVPNDVLEIERGDGKLLRYKVAGVQEYDADKVDMAKLMVSAEPGKSGLNLITCSGKVIKNTNSFDKRFVVFAVLQ